MTLTPAMQQYYDMKALYPDAILFFRMWDFYEMFDEDAKIAHSILWISLTSRNKNAENPTPLAGIPYHAKEKYLPTLLAAGYKVAIAEQVSNPSAKGIVEREVQRVITPATAGLEGEEYGEDMSSNLLVSITQADEKFGFSSIDIASGTWKCSEFSSSEELLRHIYTLFAKEIILSKELQENKELSEVFSKKYALSLYYTSNTSNPESYLKKFFETKTLSPYGLDWKSLATQACANLHEYLSFHQKSNFSFLKQLSYQEFSECMQLDEATIRSLDLVYNMSTGSYKVGTLFWTLLQTKTQGGKRKLRSEILSPLTALQEIKKRQEFITELKKDTILLDKIREELKYIADIELLTTRICLDRVGPRDLLTLKSSLLAIKRIQELLKNTNNTKLLQLVQL
jgi:DNA mismatch repair protein MutS